MVLPAFVIPFVIVALVSIVAMNFGISPLVALAQNATALIGLSAALGGIYFLTYVYTRTKERMDLDLGIVLLAVGAAIAVGGMVLEAIATLFSNTLIMIVALGFIIIVWAKREGWLE